MKRIGLFSLVAFLLAGCAGDYGYRDHGYHYRDHGYFGDRNYRDYGYYGYPDRGYYVWRRHSYGSDR